MERLLIIQNLMEMQKKIEKSGLNLFQGFMIIPANILKDFSKDFFHLSRKNIGFSMEKFKIFEKIFQAFQHSTKNIKGPEISSLKRALYEDKKHFEGKTTYYFDKMKRN